MTVGAYTRDKQFDLHPEGSWFESRRRKECSGCKIYVAFLIFPKKLTGQYLEISQDHFPHHSFKITIKKQP